MLFITFNDHPGGIYLSQVTDVCHFLNESFGEKVELVAFVSLRNYFKERGEIKKMFRPSAVLPLFPGISNWRMNQITLNLFMMFRKRQAAITRGVFATHLALQCKKISSVTFDARGAYAAEWKEYLKEESDAIVSEIGQLEKEAIEKSKYRIAVSQELINYWRSEYGYAGNNHVLIPCTLGSGAETLNQPNDLRREFGLSDNDVMLVYSGSSAGWQSMTELYSILQKGFTENSSLKLLVLSKEVPPADFQALFPGRIITKWVAPGQVSSYLTAADYGLLYRENTVTNRVSSPVKFAEYLQAGLPVIISENVGDYSRFVKEKNCGLLFSLVNWGALKKPSGEEKKRMSELAKEFFSKEAYRDNYKRVLDS